MNETERLQATFEDMAAGIPARDAEIAALRKKRDLFRGLVAEMAENSTYETEYDGRIYSICHSCGAQDGEEHRSPDCLYVRAQAALEMGD